MMPRLLHVYGPIWIQSYGFMIAVGFFIFLFLTHRHPIRKYVISSQHFINGVFWSLLMGIVGARLAYIMTDLATFQANPIDMFLPWVGGFVVGGSIIAVLIFAPLYLRSCGVNLFPLLDLVAVYAPLMQSIARIGCFLAGCCYGMQAGPGVVCAVTFTDPHGIAPLNIALHPAQLYASLASLLIFMILFVMVKMIAVKPGVPLFGYLLLEGVARFVVDFWRDDRGDLLSVGLFGKTILLSQMQLLSVFVMSIASVGLIWMLIRSTNSYVFDNYGSI